MIWIPSETNVLSVVIEPISNATSSVRSPPYNPSKWGHCPYLMPPTHINIYLSLTITVGFKVWTPWGSLKTLLGVCEGLNCVHINICPFPLCCHLHWWCWSLSLSQDRDTKLYELALSSASPWTQGRGREGRGEKEMNRVVLKNEWGLRWSWSGENKTKAWNTVQLLICFSCFQWTEARRGAGAHGVRERAEIHLEKQRPRHKGSCVPLKESALQA